MNTYIALIVFLLKLTHSVQSFDSDEAPQQTSLNTTPLDIVLEILPHLSPVDLKILKSTGNRSIQQKINFFVRQAVDQRIAQHATPDQILTRQALCDNLPFAPYDYQSRYNLITNFNRIVQVIQTPGFWFNNNPFGFERILIPPVIDFMACLNNEQAIYLRFHGILTRDYGYSRSHPIAHAFLREQASLGSPKANQILFNALKNDSYFFRQNIAEALDLLEIQIQNQQTWAIEIQYNALSKGWRMCDAWQPEAAREFLITQMDRGIPWALAKFLETEAKLLHMDTPEQRLYKKDLIEWYYQQGFPGASLAKLEAISGGYYEDDTPKKTARRFLKKSLKKGQEWARTAYLDGLKHGYYGIRQSNIKLQCHVDEKCLDGDLFFIREKYYLHITAHRHFAWDDDSIPTLLSIAIRQGEPWAISERLKRRKQLNEQGHKLNLGLLFQAYDLQIVPTA